MKKQLDSNFYALTLIMLIILGMIFADSSRLYGQGEVTPEVTSESTSESTPETTPEITPEVTPPITPCSPYENNFSIGQPAAVSDTPNLIKAIECANANSTSDTILILNSISLSSKHNSLEGNNGLPHITSAIVIRANTSNLSLSRSTIGCDTAQVADDFRFFYIAATGQLNLQNLSLSNGCANGADNAYGGAIYNLGSLSLTSVILTNNTALEGGAIYNLGTAQLDDVQMLENKSNSNGAAFVNQNLWIANELRIFNHQGLNTIYNNGTAKLQNFVLENSNNTIIRNLQNLTLLNAHIGYSSANPIYNTGTTSLTNTTISHTWGLRNQGVLNLLNVTFAYSLGATALNNSGAVTIYNSFLAQNTHDDCSTGGTWIGANNYSSDNTCSLVAGFTQNARLDLMPLEIAGNPSEVYVYAHRPDLNNAAIGGGDNRWLSEVNIGFDFNADGDILDTLTEDAGHLARRRAQNVDAGAIEMICGYRLGTNTVEVESALLFAIDCGLTAELGADIILTKANHFSGQYGNSSFYVDSSVIINGHNHRIARHPDAPEFRIFFVFYDQLTLNDVVLSNGYVSDNDGGAIYNYGSSSNLTLNNAIIENNYARNGGGIFNIGGSTIAIRNSIIQRNRAIENGGGINNNYTAYIYDSDIRENIAGLDGGGIYFRYLTTSSYFTPLLDVQRTHLRGNSAEQNGGGLAIYAPRARQLLKNNMVTGNYAGQNGGGFYVDTYESGDYPKVFEYQTIASNRAGGIGGGIYATMNSLTLDGTLLWGNRASRNYQTYPTTLSVATRQSAIQNYQGTLPEVMRLNISDPLFIEPKSASLSPTALGDYHLSPANNPLINPFFIGLTELLDIDGELRPLGASVDIGADESPIPCPSEIEEYRVDSHVLLIHAIRCIEQGVPAKIVFTGDVDFGRSSLLSLDADYYEFDGQGYSLKHNHMVIEVGTQVEISNLHLIGTRPAFGHSIQGGTIYNEGTLIISDSVLSQLIGYAVPHVEGAGLANFGVTYIYNSRFENHHANDKAGGAIFNAGELYVANSDFYNNSAQNGGGLYNRGSAIIVNSNFSYNAALPANVGAAIFHQYDVASNSKLIIINSNFSYNHTSPGNTAYGAGLYTGPDNSASPSIYNSSFYHNDGVNILGGVQYIYNSWFASAYSYQQSCKLYTPIGASNFVFGNGCNFVGFTHVPNMLVKEVDDSLLMPLPNSPLLNAGDASLIPNEASLGFDVNRDGDMDDSLETDIRGAGFPRIIGGQVDIGAYEAPNYDVNNDGILSPSDIIYIINRIGTDDLSADFNWDGQVTEADVQMLLDILAGQ